MHIEKFYSYFRSSTAYRLRIALAYKGVEPEETVFINLKEGQQHSDEYKKVNPASAVPAFELDNGVVLTQSLAMLEWLEEQCPAPALLPSDSVLKAQVRAFSQAIGCDIHPVNNLRILKYITGELGQAEEQKVEWIHHWIHKGFAPLEEVAKKNAGKYSFGNEITMADVCLIPQIYNAERFGMKLDRYPTLLKINNYCLSLECFKAAAPENQPDCNV